jgi:hypothetical protein
MEDPWANAWGEPSKSIFPDPSPTWASPPLSVLHGDHEEDLSTPSWPKEHTSDWAATDIAADDIWPSTSTTWKPEPYPFDKISLGEESYADFLETLSPSSRDTEEHYDSKASPPIERAPGHPQFQIAPVHPVSQASPILTPLSASFSEVSHTEQLTQSNDWTPARAAPLTPPSIPTIIAPPPLEDHDGFGSFETGRDTQDADRWSSKPALPEISLAWSSAWQDPYSTDKGSPDTPEDEWVAARREKERQDRCVVSHVHHSTFCVFSKFASSPQNC